MPLSSFEFILFLGLCTLAYHGLRGRQRTPLLLAFSLLYYGSLFRVDWLLALLGVGLGSWWLGLRIQAAADERARGAWLWSGLLGLLSLLGWIKYSGMAAQAIDALAAALGRPLGLPVFKPLLFVGISYYVFQAISYLCDVYFRSIRAEEGLLKVLLYFSFFPKVVQGPIERAGDFLPQLDEPYAFDAQAMDRGVLRFFKGLFKKAVLAELLGAFADRAFSGAAVPAPALLLGSGLFFAQLYLDFSGYTDMALGAGALFGLRLSENFDRPYLARSMKDFWRRWHITLSRFILDYVFQPLQVAFRDHGALGLAAALFIAFFLMGVWHGPTWTYAVFGLVQGAFMAAAVLYRPWQKRLHKSPFFAGAAWLGAWQTAFTLALVLLSFVLFRAPDLRAAAGFYRGLAVGWWPLDLSLYTSQPGDAKAWGLVAVGLALLQSLRWRWGIERLRTAPWALRWALASAGLAGLLAFGHFYAQRQFIYAQF